MNKIVSAQSEAKAWLNYVRNSVFIINALFIMIAACLTVVGIKISSRCGSYESFLDSYQIRNVQIYCAIGILSIFIALIGLAGAGKYKTLYLNMQNILLFGLLLIEFGAIVTGVVALSDIQTPIETNMLHAIERFEIKERARNTWNFVQNDSRCCGVHLPDSWHGLNQSESNGTATLNYNGVLQTFPYSCCIAYNCSTGKVFQQGCFDHVMDFVTISFKIITSTLIGVMLLQVIVMVLSYLLIQHIRRDKLSQEEDPPNRASFFISSTSILNRSD